MPGDKSPPFTSNTAPLSASPPSSSPYNLWSEIHSLAPRQTFWRISSISMPSLRRLRLHPPVPPTIWRVTFPGGVVVGDVHVPGGMNLTRSQYAVGRSEAVYLKADPFAPERWYQFPEITKDKDAFAPFSTSQPCFWVMCSRAALKLDVLVHGPIWLQRKAAGTDGHPSGAFKAGLDL
ncbi:hypothetical protein CCMA1212_008395 [Trichoderma ghanense]|uniref:Uncharacterized protein n=1 Tax=Trichoderma ghanense TaxID=65468 RepID=A0ABY2GVN5_9HYPO